MFDISVSKNLILECIIRTEIIDNRLVFCGYFVFKDTYSSIAPLIHVANRVTDDPREAYFAAKMLKDDAVWSEGFSVRDYVKERDNFTCQYCGATNKALHVDHVVSHSVAKEIENTEHGWVFNAPFNLVVACQTCNLGKSNRDLVWMKGNLAKKGIDFDVSTWNGKVGTSIDELLEMGRKYLIRGVA